MEKFVLAATQRSGTAVLESVINSHPQIYCYPEVLLSLAYQEEWSFYHFYLQKVKQDESNITFPAMLKIFDEYLKHIFNSVPKKRAIGIDIKYDQFPQILNIVQTLKKHGVRIIHLVRKNVLKTFISSVLNRNQRALGRQAHGTKKVPPVKVKFRPDHSLIIELERRAREIAYYRNIFSENFDYLEINYEDLFSSLVSESQSIDSRILDRIYDFLSIEEKTYDLETDLKKTNPNNLRDLIENYDEVADFLSNTKWGYLFGEESIKRSEECSAQDVVMSTSLWHDSKEITELIRKGEDYFEKQEYDDAISAFALAAKKDPSNCVPYNNIGVVYWQLGNLQKSLDSFTKALQLNSLDRPTVLNAINVLKALGREDVARDICGSYLKARPGDIEVKEIYAIL